MISGFVGTFSTLTAAGPPRHCTSVSYSPAIAGTLKVLYQFVFIIINFGVFVKLKSIEKMQFAAVDRCDDLVCAR